MCWQRTIGALVLTALACGPAAASPADGDRREPGEGNPTAHERESPVRPDRPPPARIAGFRAFRNDPDESRSTIGSLDRWRPWSAGIAITLATCGAIALASRRRASRYVPVELQVVGRASLTPKHGVYVLRVGRRVLVVGAGPQGPPSLITELDEAAVDAPVAPSPGPETSS